MTCILAPDSAKLHGSAADRIRLWFLVFDIPRPMADELNMEQKFFAILDSIRMENQFEFERFRLTDDVLRRAAGGKGIDRIVKRKEKPDEKWKTTHSELYAVVGMSWPFEPESEYASQFRQRELEVLELALRVFPPVDSTWQFFDLLHSAEWTFKVKGDFISKHDLDPDKLPLSLKQCQDQNKLRDRGDPSPMMQPSSWGGLKLKHA